MDLAVWFYGRQQVSIYIPLCSRAGFHMWRKRISYCACCSNNPAGQMMARRLIIEQFIHVEMRMTGQYVDIFFLVQLQKRLVNMLAGLASLGFLARIVTHVMVIGPAVRQGLMHAHHYGCD